MIRVLLIAVLMFVIARSFWSVIDGIIEAAGGAPKPANPRSRQRPVRLVRDPVCGTHVPVDASLSLTTRGTTHYFCSEECRARFRKSA